MALVGKGSVAVGVVIAVVAGLGVELAWSGWVLAVLGLIAGYLNVSDDESHSFLVAAIALILAAEALAGIPAVGSALTMIIGNLVMLLGGAVVVVTGKSLYAVLKD